MLNLDVEGIFKKHDYELVSPLGKRCFPSTFLVNSTKYKEQFVIKVVDKKWKFQNEVNSLSNLGHTNIV